MCKGVIECMKEFFFKEIKENVHPPLQNCREFLHKYSKTSARHGLGTLRVVNFEVSFIIIYSIIDSNLC